MSRIAITVEAPAALPDVIALIRRVTGMGISDIRERIRKGMPIFEYPLFYNDHDEKAREIRDLIASIASLNSRLRVYELDDDETFETCSNTLSCEISPEILINMLDEHDKAVERRAEVPDNE